MSGDAYVRASAAKDLQRWLRDVRGTGYDEHRMVSAEVSGTGELVGLTFHPAAPSLGPTRLGEAIVAAGHAAQRDARQRGYTLMAQILGDEATAIAEAGGDGRSTIIASAAPVRTEPEDDDDLLASFDASIFRSDR